MPQEIHIIGRDDEPLTLSEWESAVENTEGVRLETSLEDPDVRFEDADFFDPEEQVWLPAFRWSQWGISFNARTVGAFCRETDPVWRVVCELAEKLNALVRHDDGEPFDPVTGKMVAPENDLANTADVKPVKNGRSQELKIIFPFDSINCVHLSEAVISWLEEIGLTKNLKMDHRRVALGKIPERVENSKYGDFWIETDRFDFRYHGARAWNHDVITVKSTTSENTGFWDSIVERFSFENSFIHAYLIDSEYQYWQNQQDPGMYEANNLSHGHLKKIRRDAPPPLDSVIIDTSTNPGRRIYTKNSVIEAIGGIMWFSDHFFNLTSADKSELFQLDNIEVEEIEDFVKIAVDRDLLRNGDTNRKLIGIQNSLRLCLFPLSDA